MNCIPRGKKVMFALLTHRDEHVLAAQLENIRHFNPDAGIVLYNGGTDPDFAKNLNVPICPYSRPLKYEKLGRFLWHVMRWLNENEAEYEYLVNLDHDVLFVKHGYEQFLDETMKDSDCMGWQLLEGCDLKSFPDVRVARSMWNEWQRWGPVFRSESFLRYFNPGQVYRRDIINRMLSSVDLSEMETLFEETSVYGLEEMFYVTLANTCGGRCREYPDGHEYNEAVRWGEYISLKEAYQVKNHPSYYWIHPVKGDWLIKMGDWLLSEAILPEEPLSEGTQPAAHKAPQEQTSVNKKSRQDTQKIKKKQKPSAGKAKKTEAKKTEAKKTVRKKLKRKRIAPRRSLKKKRNTKPKKIVKRAA